MKIGILGVGVIGSAVVHGFCMKQDPEHELFISPRSKTASLELEEGYEQVTRCESNQEVLNRSDIIIISVLPHRGLEILEELSFRKDHKVINLMSDKKLEDIKAVIGETATLVHVVPLSFIAKRNGPIALYPKDETIMQLLDKLGDVVAVDSIEKIKAMAAITGLMTSYYSLMNQVANWGEVNGLNTEESRHYTTTFFEALSKHGQDHHLPTLATEMTPGGLNEMALNHLKKEEAFKPWVEVLDPIMERLKK